MYISVWLWKDCCLICIYSTFPKSMFQSSFTEDQSNTMMWLQYKISIRACVWDVEETPWARPPLSITINAHVLISTMWETIQPQKNWFNQETSVVALLPVLTLNCVLHSLGVFCSYTINTWPEKENHRRNAVICLQWSQDFQSFCSEFQWMGWSQVALKHDCNLFEITLIGHNDVGCL